MAELTVTIDRDPKAPKRNFAEAQQVDEGVAEQIRARRAQVHQMAELEESGALPPQDEPEVLPRENVDSIELVLPDGREVVFGPPSGISLTMRIVNFPNSPNPTKSLVLKTLMSVREINGRKPEVVADDISASKLANVLGDEAIDILSSLYMQYWPGVRKADMPQIKKNLR